MEQNEGQQSGSSDSSFSEDWFCPPFFFNCPVLLTTKKVTGQQKATRMSVVEQPIMRALPVTSPSSFLDGIANRKHLEITIISRPFRFSTAR